MNGVRAAPLLGTLSCVLVVALLLAPYALLPSELQEGLSAYYASSALGDVFVGFVSTLALVTAVALIGGYREQSAPDLVAGLSLAVGIGLVLVVLQWAFVADPTLVGAVAAEREIPGWFELHRWGVVGASVLLPVASGWYAASVLK